MGFGFHLSKDKNPLVLFDGHKPVPIRMGFFPYHMQMSFAQRTCRWNRDQGELLQVRKSQPFASLIPCGFPVFRGEFPKPARFSFLAKFVAEDFPKNTRNDAEGKRRVPGIRTTLVSAKATVIVGISGSEPRPMLAKRTRWNLTWDGVGVSTSLNFNANLVSALMICAQSLEVVGFIRK